MLSIIYSIRYANLFSMIFKQYSYTLEYNMSLSASDAISFFTSSIFLLKASNLEMTVLSLSVNSSIWDCKSDVNFLPLSHPSTAIDKSLSNFLINCVLPVIVNVVLSSLIYGPSLTIKEL